MKLDANILNPFIKAAVNALSTMAMLKPERKAIKLKTDNLMSGDISAMMALSGQGSGTVVISFSETLACRIFSNMINMSADAELLATELNADVEDCLREIVNLVAGGAKAEFANTELQFKIGLPSIISGKGHRITRDPKIPCISCEFEAAGEAFFLEVSLS